MADNTTNMSASQFVDTLDEMQREGYIKRTRFCGVESIKLTKRGTAAITLIENG